MELSITQRAHYEQVAAFREQAGEDNRECLMPDDCMSEDDVDAIGREIDAGAAEYRAWERMTTALEAEREARAVDADRPARLDIGSGWVSEPVR